MVWAPHFQKFPGGSNSETHTALPISGSPNAVLRPTSSPGNLLEGHILWPQPDLLPGALGSLPPSQRGGQGLDAARPPLIPAAPLWLEEGSFALAGLTSPSCRSHLLVGQIRTSEWGLFVTPSFQAPSMCQQGLRVLQSKGEKAAAPAALTG